MHSIGSSIVGTSISVVIASKGRPDFVTETIASLQRQTLKPKEIVVVVPSIEDLPKKLWDDDVKCIIGPLGLTSQRNSGITAIPATVPYVGYFDDDFELKEDYLEQAVAFMNANVSIMGISGQLLASGGISREGSEEVDRQLSTSTKSERHVFQPGKASSSLRLQHGHSPRRTEL